MVTDLVIEEEVTEAAEEEAKIISLPNKTLTVTGEEEATVNEDRVFNGPGGGQCRPRGD